MKYLYALMFLALCLSLSRDYRRTGKGLRLALKGLLEILPVLLLMIISISVLLFLVPDKMIAEYLGSNNKFTGFCFAVLFGSITIMPGFIAFPLCGILLKKGVSYMVLSAFSTTLMMVGITTYPLERKYFGTKVTIIRNAAGLFIAIIVAVITGIFYKELF